jgi:hypothetical protein
MSFSGLPMDLVCRKKDLPVEIRTRQSEFRQQWMAMKNEETICARKSGNNCLQRNECPLFLQMAIKMPCKVEHEIERWLV